MWLHERGQNKSIKDFVRDIEVYGASENMLTK